MFSAIITLLKKLSTWQEQVYNKYGIYMARGWEIEEFTNFNAPRLPASLLGGDKRRILNKEF